MNRTKAGNPNGVLLTVEQAADLTNLGTAMIRRLAEESGSSRKIGRCYRVHREKLLAYIEREYS